MTRRISQPVFLALVLVATLLLFLLAVAIVDASAEVPKCVYTGRC